MRIYCQLVGAEAYCVATRTACVLYWYHGLLNSSRAQTAFEKMSHNADSFRWRWYIVKLSVMLRLKLWPRPRAYNNGLGLASTSVLLTWPRKCAIHCKKRRLVVSYSYAFRGRIIASFSLQFRYLLRHSNVKIKKCSRLCAAGIVATRHVFFLFRNRPIYMWPKSRRFGLV